jgi:hypothetical protein
MGARRCSHLGIFERQRSAIVSGASVDRNEANTRRSSIPHAATFEIHTPQWRILQHTCKQAVRLANIYAALLET